MTSQDDKSEFLDAFYMEHGPCCAGCDWWRFFDSHTGECTRNAPVSGADRIGMLGLESCSLSLPAGHIMTPKNHHCGDFKDEFDWSTLPLSYRVRIKDRSLEFDIKDV